MKKCISCNAEYDDSLTACPECGTQEETTVSEQNAAEEHSCCECCCEKSAEHNEAPADDTAGESEEAQEPVPVVGLIIAGVIGLIMLAVGLWYRLSH